MNDGEVWEKFLPKTRRGNSSSNLSQISSSSCFSKDGRLSLSTRVGIRESWKVGRMHHGLAVTPPKPSTSKKSFLGTPSPSPKARTPSTTRRSSSKKSIPSDGKTQKSLLSYFPISASKKSDSIQVRRDIMEITLDSDSDEEIVQDKKLDKSIERKTVDSSSVSRVLFPSASPAVTNERGETPEDCGTRLSPARGSDKENQLSSPVAWTVVNNAEENSGVKKKTLSELPPGDDTSGGKRESLQTNQPTVVPSPAPEISPAKVPDKENRASPPHPYTNNTGCVNKDSGKGVEAKFVFKKKSKSPVAAANHQDNITSPAAVCLSEIHSFIVRPGSAPSVPAPVDQLGSLVKKMENHPKPQDSIDKGKRRVNTHEVPQVSKKGVLYCAGVMHQTGASTQSSLGSTYCNLRKESKCMPLTDITHSPRQCTSMCEPLLEKQKYPASNEPTENFTGVTECVSYQSSGDLWTPGDPSSPSSDEFDATNEIKVAHSKKPRRRKIVKSIEGNIERRKEKKKGKVSETTVKDKAPREGRFKISHKNIIKHKSSRDVSQVSIAQSSTSTASNIATTLEKVSFTNSGGFFPDDADVVKVPGQAFVIKSPSVEYLLNYGSLEDTSFVIEKDIACSDSESEKSSVLADIKDIDADVANSSSNTLKVNAPDEIGDVEVGSEQGNFSASTVGVVNNIQNVNSQQSLRGVTITESEWNRLPSQSNVYQTLTSKSFSVGDACESLTSAPVNYKKTSGRENSFSSHSEVVKGRQSSQDLLTERAASPSEAEEAPANDMIAGIRQNVCQQGASNIAVMSPYSYGISSQSTEIRLTSAIDPMPPPETVKNVSPNKEDKAERLASTQKVLDWIKRNPSVSHISAEITSEQCETLGKASVSCRNRVHESDGETAGQHYAIPPSTMHGNMTKSCVITCQVKVLITLFYKNTGKGVEVFRKDCATRCKSQHNIDKFRKASASLTAVIYDIPSVINLQAGCGKSKNQLSGNFSIANNSQLHNHVKDSTLGHEIQNISANVKATYGKWGWNELEIECLDEGCEESDSSSVGEQLGSSNFSIQKVNIYLCKCSRSIVVECIVLRNGVNIDNNSVGRSKFHASLKEYESCWGVPDDPVTLTAVAYSKISSHFYPESLRSDVRSLNPCIVAEKKLPDLLSQISQSVNEDIQEDENSAYHQDEIAGKWEPTPLLSQISDLLRDDEGPSFSDLDTTPTDSSDLEWLTQECEASKIYAVDQWQPLMQKMRNGGISSSNSKSALSKFSDTPSSSFASTLSQETYTQNSLASRTGYGGYMKPKVCPFYKKIEGTRFAVDAFNFGSIAGVTYYFLSHFHYDHYIGLKKSFSHHIYCSSVTGKLVASKLGVRPDLIRRIDPGQTIKVDGVVVTALDANHCPGSIMLLFQLPSGATHLHVGDFRAHLGMESFHAFWNVRVNNLYLDTTYCDPTYTFPSQERVIDNVLAIVESAISENPKTLIVCGSYTIGKERVFAAIAERFQFKIWTIPEKRRVLECVRGGLQELCLLDKDSPGITEGGAAREVNLIRALNMLTMVKEAAQIHVLPMAKIKPKCLIDHLQSMRSSAFTNIIAFRPTGWAYGRMKGGNESNQCHNSSTVKIYEVAYSEHSSFLELARFVKFIKPEKVVKTVVGSSREREAMDKHINSWLREARSKVPVPNRSCDSPKSSQVALQQREAGEFAAKRRNNLLARRFSNSQGSLLNLFGSCNAQTSVDSNSLKSDFGSKQTEKSSSIQSQLFNGARKRLGSPYSNGRTLKKHHS